MYALCAVLDACSDESRRVAYMEFIFSRLKHRNEDGSLQIMYTIHGACWCFLPFPLFV